MHAQSKLKQRCHALHRLLYTPGPHYGPDVGADVVPMRRNLDAFQPCDASCQVHLRSSASTIVLFDLRALVTFALQIISYQRDSI